MKSITILPGHDKNGVVENFDSITLEKGKIYSIVGNTGSGKSRLMKDIEALAAGDTVTGRKVLVDGSQIPLEERGPLSFSLVAHLSQYMRFSVDASIEDFITLHARARGKKVCVEKIVSEANKITSEPIRAKMNLAELSGGQSRALMISDIAYVSDCPIVLIDEIENAGIAKEEAIRQLVKKDKLVLLATHDVHTALYAGERLVMANGAVSAIRERSQKEEELFKKLSEEYRVQLKRQSALRSGEELV